MDETTQTPPPADQSPTMAAEIAIQEMIEADPAVQAVKEQIRAKRGGKPGKPAKEDREALAAARAEAEARIMAQAQAEAAQEQDQALGADLVGRALTGLGRQGWRIVAHLMHRAPPPDEMVDDWAAAAEAVLSKYASAYMGPEMALIVTTAVIAGTLYASPALPAEKPADGP